MYVFIARSARCCAGVFTCESAVRTRVGKPRIISRGSCGAIAASSSACPSAAAASSSSTAAASCASCIATSRRSVVTNAPRCSSRSSLASDGSAVRHTIARTCSISSSLTSGGVRSEGGVRLANGASSEGAEHTTGKEVRRPEKTDGQASRAGAYAAVVASRSMATSGATRAAAITAAITNARCRRAARTGESARANGGRPSEPLQRRRRGGRRRSCARKASEGKRPPEWPPLRGSTDVAGG